MHYENSANQEDLRRCLRTGGAGIVHVRANQGDYVAMFTKSGHYMTVINEEPDGRLAILDPAFEPDRYSDPKWEGLVEVKHNYVVLCDPQVLHGETQGKTGPYYLFWRA